MNATDILLIEDNPTDTELILRTLKKQNPDLKVQVINDGALAIEFLSELSNNVSKNSNKSPRVILLDLDMPKVDGFQVLRRVKADKFINTIPVVILTSSTNEKDIAECYKSQANSYVVKPLDYENFFQAISAIVHYWIDLNNPPIFSK